ncbi:hypothetical protein BDP81DRAFT_187595, partial [Colletotrichum phormii]
ESFQQVGGVQAQPELLHDNPDSGSSQTREQHRIDPFTFNTDFSLAICKRFRYVVVGDEVYTHLRTQHQGIKVAERKRITRCIQSLDGIVRSQTDLAKVRCPPPTSNPIPHLAPAVTDGIQCHNCGYLYRRVSVMQRHCREEHNWVNDYEKGGDIRRKLSEARETPWTVSIQCQRFATSRCGQRWFEVGRNRGIVQIDS